GQFTGSLSNGGDTLRLTDAALNTIDQVGYGAGFPWPTVGDPVGANGTGPSIQLINPGMDNDLGGNWRSAVPTPGGQNSVFSGNSPRPSRGAACRGMPTGRTATRCRAMGCLRRRSRRR